MCESIIVLIVTDWICLDVDEENSPVILNYLKSMNENCKTMMNQGSKLVLYL